MENRAKKIFINTKQIRKWFKYRRRKLTKLYNERLEIFYFIFIKHNNFKIVYQPPHPQKKKRNQLIHQNHLIILQIAHLTFHQMV